MTPRFGPGYVVEHRFARDIAEGAIAEGVGAPMKHLILIAAAALTLAATSSAAGNYVVLSPTSVDLGTCPATDVSGCNTVAFTETNISNIPLTRTLSVQSPLSVTQTGCTAGFTAMIAPGVTCGYTVGVSPGNSPGMYSAAKVCFNYDLAKPMRACVRVQVRLT